MMTLLQSALTGWTDYTQHGKFAALLLLAILYLGFVLYGSGKEANASGAEKARKRLYLYGALVTFGCICPVTALILLKYQTAFYSYVWIWAAVPQTALIAWAATDFLCNLLKEKSLRNGMAALILLGILFLGGNPVSEWTVAQTTQIPALTGMPGQQQGTPAREILEQLSVYNAEKGNSREYSLWAPKEVMEAARAYSAENHPVYGRSIWDASLGSYSYDTYETWQEDLYLWMSHLETTGETEYLRTDENTTTEAGGRKIDFAACLDSAGKAGIDYILLPEDLSEDVQKELQEAADGGLRSFGVYFLIVM